MNLFIVNARRLNARQYSRGTLVTSIAWPPGMPGARMSIGGAFLGSRARFMSIPTCLEFVARLHANCDSFAIRRSGRRDQPRFWRDSEATSACGS
jgi:hypothetical protein